MVGGGRPTSGVATNGWRSAYGWRGGSPGFEVKSRKKKKKGKEEGRGGRGRKKKGEEEGEGTNEALNLIR